MGSVDQIFTETTPIKMIFVTVFTLLVLQFANAFPTYQVYSTHGNYGTYGSRNSDYYYKSQQPISVLGLLLNNNNNKYHPVSYGSNKSLSKYRTFQQQDGSGRSRNDSDDSDSDSSS